MSSTDTYYTEYYAWLLRNYLDPGSRRVNLSSGCGMISRGKQAEELSKLSLSQIPVETRLLVWLS